MNKKQNISNGWIYTSIENVVYYQKGKKPKQLKESKFPDSKPYLDIRAFELGEIRRYADIYSSNLCTEEDIIMVWDGARSGWVSKGADGAIGSTLARLKPFIINQNYLFYFLQSKFNYINSNAKGSGIPHVDPVILWGLKFPLPPLKEQHRIVDTIEELFSDLDNSVSNLKFAKNQLEVYRQALLKHAFAGKLTEQWRKNNNPESAEKLLERIKKESKNRHDQELRDWKELVAFWEKDGKKGKKPKKPTAAISFTALNKDALNFLPDVPKGWKWVRNNDLLYYVTSGSRDWKKYYSDKGAYFLRTQDIKTNRLKFENAAFVSLPDDVEGKRSLVEKGDLLMTITGANVGKVAYIDSEISEAYVSQSVALMKPINKKISSYLHLYFLSDVYGGKLIRGLVYGVGRPVLSLENIREAAVALCSYEEQEQIVSEIESQFSIIDNLEQTIDYGLQKSEALRQSILKKAFEGKLVPQDLNDGSASKLLKDIQVKKKMYLEDQKLQKKKSPKKPYNMAKELSIEEVLKTADKPMLGKDVWQQSKHKDSIEEFYAELKKIQKNIKEVKKGTESLLTLTK
jgi:type I restriction enzyme S subunit